MPDLKEVIISITNRCNLQCRMCDIPRNKADELATSGWKEVIQDAASCGAQTIVFSGGEPLLRQDIFELISFAKANSLSACITSNGGLIDKETARKLREAGVGVVNISLEGPRRVHDYLRGKGSHQRAEAALEHLRNNGIESTIATIVSRHNFKDLPYAVEAAKRCGATTVKFQPFSRIFLRPERSGKGFSVPAASRRKLAAILQEVIRLCGSYGIATNPTVYLENIPAYLSGEPIGLRKGCPALYSSCPINSNGDVYPCWTIGDTLSSIGSVRNERLSVLWSSPQRLRVLEAIQRQGCPLCMMSCYDRNFGGENVGQRIALNVKRLRARGAREYARRLLKKWSKRIQFYRSYRPGLRQIALRCRGALQKKAARGPCLPSGEAKTILREIEAAQKILREEMSAS